MNDEQVRFERLMDLYNDTLELDDSQRAAFLDTQCNGDATLRAEVETLLACAASATPLPSRPAWEPIIAQMAAEPGEDLTGKQLGHYEIRARIGAGGMGEVWKAWDDSLKREVAIKILPAELAADPDYLTRFQQEARAASALQHANIITIYEVGQATTSRGALPFIVTEFIEGQTLRDYLMGTHASSVQRIGNGSPCDSASATGTHASSVQHAGSVRTQGSWRDAVRLATQIASALSAAHAAYLIHRDIKPENIMVQAKGQVKVLDFGIAKGLRIAETEGMRNAECGLRIEEAETLLRATQDDAPLPQEIPHSAFRIPHSEIPPSAIPNPQLTRPGARLGTPRYMSPEQAHGAALDERTDIFSFGVVLFELLTGQRPYGQAEGDELIRRLTSTEEIEPVSQRLPNIPAALDRIVARALRKNRDERYASASKMLSDLQQLRINREEKGLRRLRTQSANQVLTQFVVRYDEDKKTRIPLGGLWTIWRFADLQRGKLERELMRKSRWNVLWRLGGLALGIAAVTMLIAAWASVNEVWEERVLRDGHTAAVRRAVFSPDGRLLVSVGEDKQVIVWDFAKRERLATFTDHQDWVTTVAFSPDSKWFATASSDGSVIVWDAARLEKAAILPGRHGIVRAIAFSADGRTLVIPTDDDRKNIWEVGSWKKLQEVRTDGFQQGHFLLSPDGRWVMVPFGDTYELGVTPATNDTRPYFWGGSTPITKDTHPPHWSWAALAPDGRRIISIDAGGFVAFSEIARFSHPTERKLMSYQRMHQDSGRAVAFSPDGRLAASGAEDIVLWDALTHKKLGRFRHQVGVSSLAFSPDGHWLVSAHGDGAILTWDTTELELVGDFAGHSEAVGAVAFAPNGKRIASASEDGSVIVWDTQQNRKEGVLLWHPIQVNAVAFSADSQWLASNDLDGNVAMWDVAERKLRWAQKETKRVPSEASYGVAVSPDGNWVATSYGVYEGGTGKLIYDFRAELPSLPSAGQSIPQSTEIRGLAFTADGRALITVSTRTGVIIRQTGQWQPRETQKLKDRRFVSLGLSLDGKQLVTGEDGGIVQLWTAQPLRPTEVLGKHDARIKSVAFSPDGAQVVSAGDDKTIALWDVGSRRLVTRIGLHTSPVYAVAFSPDGQQLVSGEHDHSVRLYTRRRSLWGWRWK